MNYRKMGKSGLKISEIAIGTWLICDGAVETKTAEAIVKRAIDLGINFVDIADRYAHGKAEEVVGRAIRGIQRSDLVISSKVFWPMSDNINDRGLSRKHIMEAVDKSLRRIGTDYLDIYFCHRFDSDTESEEVVRAMDDLVHRGKILYWGTSVWSAAEIEQAVGEARILQAYKPAVEQPRYNMIDRHIERDIMGVCRRYGLGLTVWSPLAQGLLTGKYNDGVPKNSRGDVTLWLKEDLTPANIQKAKKLAALAQKLDITLSQLALAWVLRRPEITCALTGATRVEHVEMNVMAGGVELSDETLTEIETILDNDPNKRLETN
ncbi:MAG: aldo/keto reductase family protein [candidate division Zixibacteria bacterium]|nr:aldo/keto reductase family protein [candidate division Zixibacteria bacterium]